MPSWNFPFCVRNFTPIDLGPTVILIFNKIFVIFSNILCKCSKSCHSNCEPFKWSLMRIMMDWIKVVYIHVAYYFLYCGFFYFSLPPPKRKSWHRPWGSCFSFALDNFRACGHVVVNHLVNEVDLTRFCLNFYTARFI